ncbi:MAG: hypothetical protein AAB016_06435, partial [candidate division NC10 bacterium]
MTDPLRSVRPHGTVVIHRPGPAGRPLLVWEADRHGTPHTVAEWDDAGRLRQARVRLPDGSWIGIEPAAAESPAWGRSDRLWLLELVEPFQPVEPITLFHSVDYAAVGF